MPRFQLGPLPRIRAPDPTCPPEPTCRDDIAVRLPLTEEERIRRAARVHVPCEWPQRLAHRGPARGGGSTG